MARPACMWGIVRVCGAGWLDLCAPFTGTPSFFSCYDADRALLRLSLPFDAPKRAPRRVSPTRGRTQLASLASASTMLKAAG